MCICSGDTMIAAQPFTNKVLRLSKLAFLLSFSSQSFAFCFNEAGETYNVNPLLLKAISYTESRLDPNAINKANSNGTYDIGLMQINSNWFPMLIQNGVNPDLVKTDPCANVFVGAWILAQNFETSGEGWLAVGAYNAGYSKRTEAARKRYIELVKQNFERLQE